MAVYELKVFHQSTIYDKVWATIEADSPEEALALAKEYPDTLDWQDSKCLDVTDGEWVDMDSWEVVEEIK